jgi:hypothetical protein
MRMAGKSGLMHLGYRGSFSANKVPAPKAPTEAKSVVFGKNTTLEGLPPSHRKHHTVREGMKITWEGLTP